MIQEESTKKFSVKSRLKSFRYAARGIMFCVRTQHNAWLHLIAASLVIITGLFLRVSASDWRWLMVCIALVWFAEVMNTAFEYLCDLISPEFHESVKRAKDIAAGAVLICSIAAALTGMLTFWPYIAGCEGASPRFRCL